MNSLPQFAGLSKSPLPNDLDAERKLLGSIFTKPALFDIAMGVVWPEDFFVVANQKIYEAIARMDTLNQLITRDGVEAAAGVPVHFIPSASGDDNDALEWAKRIRSAAILREAATADSVRDWAMGGGA